jgi:Domain of unknown function (DUF6602)
MTELATALRDRLVAQAKVFASASSHRTVTGTGRENALADLLREVLPRRFEVLSGVIVPGGKTVPTKSRRQVDLILADTLEYPLLARSGDLAVVLPNAVRAVIEVKTRVSGDNELQKALEQMAETALESDSGAMWHSALFSFSYPADSESLRRDLELILQRRKEAQAALANPGPANDDTEQKKNRRIVSLLADTFLPDLIVSDKGAIAMKSSNAYEFFTTGDSLAALVLVAEVLTAIALEVKRTGAHPDQLASEISEALDAHRDYLGGNPISANLDPLSF